MTATGENPTRGRLFGKNVLEGTFRAPPDEDLFLGELLVAVDEAMERAGVPAETRERAFDDRHRLMERH